MTATPYMLYSRNTGYTFTSPSLETDEFSLEDLETAMAELYASSGYSGTPFRFYFPEDASCEVMLSEGAVVPATAFTWGAQGDGYGWLNERFDEENWVVAAHTEEDVSELLRHDRIYGFYIGE